MALTYCRRRSWSTVPGMKAYCLSRCRSYLSELLRVLSYRRRETRMTIIPVALMSWYSSVKAWADSPSRMIPVWYYLVVHNRLWLLVWACIKFPLLSVPETPAAPGGGNDDKAGGATLSALAIHDDLHADRLEYVYEYWAWAASIFSRSINFGAASKPYELISNLECHAR